ncbi:MAG: isoprenylcysteine carboxylmethyltransferase family protein [Thermodesulfobacteriota bacterium]
MPKIIKETNTVKNPARSKPLDIILKIGAFFIILEPIWMLLPFAGFLYGSVMHIEALSKNPYTARLVYFVLPVHSLFPLGLILILTGLLVFLAGACQIYSGKALKKGLIRTGIYRKFRHPQYLALTIFGLGIILTWGRFITFIAFFIMLWLYYFLARNEEMHCRELFGREYDEYRATTYFLFPGENLLLAAVRKLPAANFSTGGGILLSFLLVVGLAGSSGLLIIKAKTVTRNTLPVITGDFQLLGHVPDKIPLLMVKGPALQAAPAEKIRTEFMEKSFEMLLSSPKIAGALKELDLADDYTLLVFLTPGSNWYSTAHLDYRRAKLESFIFCIKTPVAFSGENFREFRRSWQITHLLRANEMSYGRFERGLDPAEGEIITEPFKARMEERIDFFLSGL